MMEKKKDRERQGGIKHITKMGEEEE